MCSIEQNKLQLNFQEQRYSFQDQSVSGSSRSRIIEPFTTKNMKTRSDSNLINRLMMGSQKNQDQNTFSAFAKVNPKTHILKKRKHELGSTHINEAPVETHYFNEKYYENKQAEIRNKIWVILTSFYACICF